MHEDLIQLVERSKVDFPKFGTGVSQAVIAAAEQALGVPLPDSYKWWLLNYGGGQIRADIVYGLDEVGMGRPDIVELAKMNQQDGLYDINRLVICMGNAENFFFDTRSRCGEYPVLMHDVIQNESFPYADNFADFLRRRIREVYPGSN